MVSIKILHDEFASFDLLEELHSDDFGTFVAWHSRRNLGKVNYPNHEEFLKNVQETALKIPIFLHEHGGMLLGTSPFACPFDSGMVGVWVFTVEDLTRIYGEDSSKSRDKAMLGVVTLIQHMNDINNGNIWMYEIEDFDGDVADRCGGFVGDDAIRQMKEVVPENLHASLDAAWELRFE